MGKAERQHAESTHILNDGHYFAGITASGHYFTIRGVL